MSEDLSTLNQIMDRISFLASEEELTRDKAREIVGLANRAHKLGGEILD